MLLRKLGWERGAGTAASDGASDGKWRGQTTSSCENSPEDIGMMFRAQPQPMPSLPARPWPRFTCPISSSAKEEQDIIFFLPFLPAISVFLGVLSSSPWHAQQPVRHGVDGTTVEMERVTVRYSPSALIQLLPTSQGQTHQNPVLYSSRLQYGLIWSECTSLSDLTQIMSKATLAGSA